VTDTAAATTVPILEVEDLQVHFPLRRKRVVRAVDGVSFAITPGESVGLIGESGSGKSTVARAVMQLVAPTAGTVRLRGRDLGALDRGERRALRRRYQMVFQDSGSALNPRITIGSSMREPLDVQGIAKGAAADAIVKKALQRVGLTPGHGARYPHELSGGQRQRVNIARALVLDPELLVCDEAVSALDLSLQAEVLNLLDDLRRDLDLAFLFIGHDLTVVAHVTDRLGVMYLGKLMELGPTDDVMERPVHPYTIALRSAEPEIVPASMRARTRVVLDGDIPSPIAPPSGCVFHTRCPDAQPSCATDVPDWRPLGPDRWVACHFPHVEPTPRGAQE
jgi:peptide/nickel transport system ATP-binding protein/oligopeptide transport system ATP-binding protein